MQSTIDYLLTVITRRQIVDDWHTSINQETLNKDFRFSQAISSEKTPEVNWTRAAKEQQQVLGVQTNPQLLLCEQDFKPFCKSQMP